MKCAALFGGLVVASLVGCQSPTRGGATPPPATGMINSNCPFSGQPVGVGAPAATLDDGRTVGFCCQGCAQRWNGWDQQQQQQYIAAQRG